MPAGTAPPVTGPSRPPRRPPPDPAHVPAARCARALRAPSRLVAEHGADAVEHQPRCLLDRERDRSHGRRPQSEHRTVARVERRHGPVEQRAVARAQELGERRVLDEADDLVRARVGLQLAALEVAVHLRTEFGVGLGGVLDAHQPAGDRPLAHVGIGSAGDRPAPELRTPEEGVGEGEVHPAREVRVVRRVRLRDAVSVDVLAAHPLVQLPHPLTGVRGLRGVTVRDGVDPADGAGEATERVFAVAGVVGDTCERAGVQRLHEQRPDAGEDGLLAAVHGPGGGAGPEEAGVGALFELVDPGGALGGATGERVVEAGTERVGDGWHAAIVRRAPDNEPRPADRLAA